MDSAARGLGETGSSPRTWGTPMQRRCRRRIRRFIPTHAGNTSVSCSSNVFSSVHPHARGEHTTALALGTYPIGSSPRTWGTLARAAATAKRRRFIPTHVGNTACAGSRPAAPAVHPHARGEHLNQQEAHMLVNGSSPRTWGTPHQPRAGPPLGRFIPTHVGNTRPRQSTNSARPVHPHARGEHKILPTIPTQTRGSSPRTWGTL